jgi:hypothetical protein
MRDYDPTLARYLSVDPLGSARQSQGLPRLGQNFSATGTPNVPSTPSQIAESVMLVIPQIEVLKTSDLRRRLIDSFDALFQRGSWNEYSYVSANPQNRIDALGGFDRPAPRIIILPKPRPRTYCRIPAQEVDQTPLDDCVIQWIDDTKWCDNKFKGRRNIACHAWAKEELDRCKRGLPRQPFRT